MATDQNQTNATNNGENNNATSIGAGYANNANFTNAQNNMNASGFAGYGNMGNGYGYGAGGFGGANAGYGAGANAGMLNPYFATAAQPQNPYLSQPSAQGGILATLTAQKSEILKGAAIGAVAAFILTNPTTQSAIFKGIAKLSSLLEMGVEELKERYEDAKAEVNAI